jgi:magnesium transporter
MSSVGETYPEGAPRGRTRTRLYRDGKLEREDFPLAEVSDLISEDGAVVWADILAPRPEDVAQVAEELGLHPLAVEDALAERQRPKLDRYRTHLFLTVYAVRLNPDSCQLSVVEIAAFITPRALITIRESEGLDLAELTRRWDDTPDLARFGVGFLVHGLLDLVVDGHFDAAQRLDDAVEELEDALFADDSGGGQQVQRRGYELRKSLVLARRVVLPTREVVNSLMRRDLGVVDEHLQPYYTDVYDHVLRATDWLDGLRDLITTILETRLTIQGNRLNEIMKKLTAYAALVAVPTAVTGFFGQNVPFPGFQQRSGWIASIVVIVSVALLLFVLFRRKDYL